MRSIAPETRESLGFRAVDINLQVTINCFAGAALRRSAWWAVGRPRHRQRMKDDLARSVRETTALLLESSRLRLRPRGVPSRGDTRSGRIEEPRKAIECRLSRTVDTKTRRCAEDSDKYHALRPRNRVQLALLCQFSGHLIAPYHGDRIGVLIGYQQPASAGAKR